MKIKILTLFPEMFDGFLNTSIIKRAIDKELVSFEIVDIRPFTKEKHGHVDDTPFGGGKGMVLMCQPCLDALKSVKSPNSKVFLMGPIGSTFNQEKAKEMAMEDEIIILCGHYEGVDQRIKNYIDEELSIGDYILTGGELASMVISDAIVRLIDGVIKKESHEYESFEDGLLEHPHYTKPANYDGMEVPSVLLSGHHENIRKYRLKESLRMTYLHRKDLLENRDFTKEERKMLDEIIKEEKATNN